MAYGNTLVDRIISSYLDDFVAKNDHLKDFDRDHAFELFINDLIISRDYPEEYDTDAVSVRGMNDLGMDGVAIVVNEHLVFSVEDIRYFTTQLHRLDARFIFIQTKTSPGFDGGEIGKFLFGVRAFFNPIGVANEKVRSAYDLKEAIYNSSKDMDAAPRCDLFYASLGKWSNEPHLQHLVKTELNLLRSTNLFSDVTFTPLDAEMIKASYRELNRKVSKEIVFERHTNLPAIAGVEQAYIGSLPATEYLKLICDEGGRLQRSLFYDNVRDFQGNNSVNQDISKTLNDSTLRDRFIVLNNGITIVSKSLTQVGPKFKLSDFQIVNGCQTSHVLFYNRQHLSGAEIPIKLIITQDAEVTNSVIRATNRQTEVKEEAFESLNPFQKELEEFYERVEGDNSTNRLYYERRSKQFDQTQVNRKKVVSLTAQIKSFVAMFLSEPHSTHRYYGELMEAKRAQMFVADHSPFPYYIAAKAYIFLEAMFSNVELERKHIPFKYQMLMVFRLLAESSTFPALNNRKEMDKYCGPLLSLLKDEKKGRELFACAASIVEKTKAHRDYGPQISRIKTFTTALIEAAGKSSEAIVPIHRERGFVVKFSEIKGFGFIKPENSKGEEKDLYVHAKDIRGTGYRSLNEGELVEFTRVVAPQGPRARATDVSRSHDAKTV